MTMFGYNVLGFGAFSASGPYAVDVLVVAGGGGGGRQKGGGGGAGGLRDIAIAALPRKTDFTVTVGAGGSGNSTSQAGSNSEFSGTGIDTITAAGGGGGGYGISNSPSPRPYTSDGQPGGSGGGGGYYNGSDRIGGVGNTPSVSPAQGFDGGAGDYSAPGFTIFSMGGGGGASEDGDDGVATGPGSAWQGGDGGDGVDWKSLGTYYAGGGGGAFNVAVDGYAPGGYTRSVGGQGNAGGRGGTYIFNNTAIANTGQAGTTNKGGGGGGGNYPGSVGGSYPGTNGGAGGSGVVIVRYQAAAQIGSGGTVTSAGGYIYHTFTSSGTFASN